MRSPALAQFVIAEALRACVRGANLYGEVRGDVSTSLVRELLALNSVEGLDRVLVRLTACGDLAAPISTYAETAARETRLQNLYRHLPATRTLLETAGALVGSLPVGVLAPADGELLPAVRGHLLALDETRVRAAEARFRRTELGGADGHFDPVDQARRCIAVLHDEAAAWRIVDTTQLANRLLLDRGVLDTFGQGRKRARAVLRAHTQADGDILQIRELSELLRWHRSLVVQMDLLGELDRGVLVRRAGWEPLLDHAHDLEALLLNTHDVLLLWKALGGAAGSKRRKLARTEWPRLVESLTEFLRERSGKCLAALPGVYGVSKSNFRGLIGSESA